MLMLSRKIGEKIVINEDIFFTVVEIKGGQVRLGFDAPADISIHREEIFLKIKAEQSALNASGRDLDVSLMDAFQSHQKAAMARSLTH